MPFMTHPQHGATNVGSGDVASHEANGWKLDTFENWGAAKRGVVEDAEEVAPVRNKPGRKPKVQ